MIENYINNIKFCYNNSFSIEDKIRDLFGNVCFYREHPFVKRFKRQIKLMRQFSKQEMPKKDKGIYYNHSRETKGVEISTIAEHHTLPPIVRYQSPLHPKNVDPRNRDEVKRCIKEEIAYAQMLESSSRSPFTHPLVQRTHREP